MRILSMALAFLLALTMLAPYLAPLQEAEAAELGGEATLTIVFGQDFNGADDVRVNVTYPFIEGATVEDLFEAAVAEGSLDSYMLDAGGFLSSCTQGGSTLTNASNMKTYWAFFVDGTFYAGAESLKTLELVDGSSYQLAWDSYFRTVIPDWSAITDTDDGTAYIAGGGAAAAGTATLIITPGFESFGGLLAANPAQWYTANSEYSFSDAATVADLLDAGVNNSENTDPFFDGYSLNQYGYLESVDDAVLEYLSMSPITAASDFSTYWSFYVDGQYYSGSESLDTLTLKDGSSYQFAFASYPSAVPPTETSFNSISATASAGTGIAGFTKPADPVQIDEADINKLATSIANTLTGTGDAWAAMSLAAAGLKMPDSVDQQALLDEALNAYNNPDTTNLQRSIIALTAIGIDATQVPYPASSSQAGTYNLVDKLLNTGIATRMLNGQMFALLAIASGPYVVPTGTVDNLVDSIANQQLADGGFAWNTAAGAPVDADMTAMAVAALASQKGNAVADGALQKALTALQLYQLSDGSWGAYDSVANDIVSNIYSTATAVVALSAAGIDPATQWVRDNGATPLSALLTFANADSTAFGDNAMANEQGFRALVAYQGLEKTQSAYNIYTQAKLGQASITASQPGSQPQTNNNAGLPSAGTGATGLPAAGNNSTGLPSTGESYAQLLAITFSICLLLTACGVLAYTSRKRQLND